MGDQLPPGYRFYPTEEELICFYLRNKLDGRRDDIERVIPVVDVCSVDPWHLPEIHQNPRAGEGEPWFYFSQRQEQVARGGRPRRMTPTGYWKAAGTPGVVYSADHRPIGMKKTMVFYSGRAPAGSKTKWKMNEYRAFQDAAPGCLSTSHAAAPSNLPPPLRSEFSLCRLYTKSGCLRQFDRRPAAAAGGGSENPGPSTAGTASRSDERMLKRKKSGSNDGTSSDDDGSRGSMQQQQLMQLRGDGDAYLDLDDMTAWPNFLDWS